MNALQTFDFESQAVRSFERDGQVWFVAADVCRALGLTNSRMALQALDDDEKGVSSIYTPGGRQEMAIISEPGLYTIILRCREATKPGSLPHRFRKWVTGEVLPALRKTGRYSMRAGEGEASTFDYERIGAMARLVSEARHVYGREAARALWERLPLPQVPNPAARMMYEGRENDGPGCLAHLMCRAAGNGQSLRTVIEAAWRDGPKRSWLFERGIKVVLDARDRRGDHIAIADRHPFLQQVFAETCWADDWFLPLLSVEGAKASRRPMEFGHGVEEKSLGRVRAVLIPKLQVQLG
ncbi:BRO-N domain-containing protein [Methylobacterium nodulans]|uniref:Prophage antirepressor n=1 Tax=Methylobacterium nodulans (strain LMG 21967 / CNCM I-2342 / ORS 2060) TaxID=460265 RepID=B8IDP0_METNO|nr:Bro-N domain-containing protein [Methylobacterium nodulans]ACL55612.1 prophage antirepressor [Methylobacterium nodulans ORS 2060]